MSKKSKHRDFTFIIYPESVEEHWVTSLEELGIEMAISPLHDKDKREKKDVVENDSAELREVLGTIDMKMVWDGWTQEQVDKKKEEVMEKYGLENSEFKKPHHHVIYIAKNPVTTDAVRNRVRRVLGKESLSMVQVVDNVESLYSYLTHDSKSAKDKSKYVYDKEDIIHLNDFDIENYMSLSKGEKTKVSREIIDIIHDNRLSNYYQLEKYVRENGQEVGMKIAEVRMVAKEQSSFLRLIFDGVYQEFRRQ